MGNSCAHNTEESTLRQRDGAGGNACILKLTKALGKSSLVLIFCFHYTIFQNMPDGHQPVYHLQKSGQLCQYVRPLHKAQL